MATNQRLVHVLSEATAIRLFNSAVATNESNDGIVFARQRQSQNMQQTSIESIGSTSLLNNSCRICRWNRSDMELKKCPCMCKGSVGFIHFACLKMWIMHRRDNHCEICNAFFDIPKEKFSIRRMLKSFFCYCAGPILKHLLFSVSLIPLIRIILQQVFICMENINTNSDENLSVKDVTLAASALMGSSALFFHFFEFITTRFILIQNILKQWWSFGNSPDFTLIQMDNDIFDLFA